MNKIILLLLFVVTPVFGQDIRVNRKANCVLTGGTSSSLAPADATSYYFGYNFGGTIASHAAESASAMTAPVSGKITQVIYQILVGTNGTSEAVTHILRVNGANGATLSAAETYDPGANVSKTFRYTGLSVPVVAGQTIALLVTTPTWATNPTTVSTNILVYIE